MEKKTKVILDISHFNTVKDWRLLTERVSFLIFKATEGTSFVDPKCFKTIEHCEKHGIPYWLYAFVRKGHETDQARYLVEKTKDKVGRHFIGYCLDCELGNAELACWNALDYIKKYSKKTMIYTAYQYYHLYKNLLRRRGNDCAWWEPRYDVKEGPHKGADLWQYSQSWSCSYIDGDVDINRLTGLKPLSWFITSGPEIGDDNIGDLPENDIN